MPLFNGENLFTPASRERSVQMFLERIEYGEKPVCIVCFDFIAQAQFCVMDAFCIQTFFLVYIRNQ